MAVLRQLLATGSQRVYFCSSGRPVELAIGYPVELGGHVELQLQMFLVANVPVGHATCVTPAFSSFLQKYCR